MHCQQNTSEKQETQTGTSVALLLGPKGRSRPSFGAFPLLKLVVGPLCECSKDLHELLNTMAESKMQYLSRSRGEFESEWKTASHLSYLRRQISVCAVRGMAESLLVRLQQAGVGPGGGAAQAAKRRAQAMAREERGRRERAAHWLQHTRGYRVLNCGQFMSI